MNETSRTPLLTEQDIYLLAEGRHQNIGDCLGAHLAQVDGEHGARFAVWAPNASAVSVVGDFNGWDGRRNPLWLRAGCGVWEGFVPGVKAGAAYKYELHDAHGQLLPLKADPCARRTELPPATASVVAGNSEFKWSDDEWMQGRAARQQPSAPMSIYELHAQSWLRLPPKDEGAEEAFWPRTGPRLIAYARDMGYTHIELLPITEHPFGGSWGYQPLGLYAPSARYGTPEQLMRFIDDCHAAGLGVIMDWVPAHFPADEHGLARFDGTALYEHADPRQGFHPDWNSLIYNLGRNEVRNFLFGSALEWLRRFHIDGLRVDAVASMLYLDYSRAPGEWVPNRHGGRENLEAVQFLRDLNTMVRELCPGAIMIAEESTAWPGVSAPVEEGGLGFHYKWNMGWMHDTLRYMSHDPVHRRYHHNDMTFGMVYAYSEQFILPLSHDEVVHGKGSLLRKMPGDEWQRFANLRAYMGFMWTHPGRKLLFMGGDIAQESEWNHDAQVDWACLDGSPLHGGQQRLVRDLNRLYRGTPALHAADGSPEGFRWVIGNDTANSVLAYLRVHEGSYALVVCNFTPLPRRDYHIGVPVAGGWVERLNTDAEIYGGSNMGNAGLAQTQARALHGWPQSLALTLPPLATLVLIPQEQ